MKLLRCAKEKRRVGCLHLLWGKLGLGVAKGIRSLASVEATLFCLSIIKRQSQKADVGRGGECEKRRLYA